MKTLMGTILFFILSAASFGQSQVRGSHIEITHLIASPEIHMLHNNNRMFPKSQNPTFSKAHSLYGVSTSTISNDGVLGSTIWGGVIGMAFGASIVLADNTPDYRPKAHEALAFSAVGAGVGVVAGLVTGMIKSRGVKK